MSRVLDVVHKFIAERESGAGLPARIVVGLSGGLDSSVLLVALSEALRGKNSKLMAVHVHHGLSAHADEWATHCEDLARSLDVPLVVEKVKVGSGPSLENEARRARRKVFAGLLMKGDVLALAHHARDQAETVLFRLMRGTGLDGLSAMAGVDVFEAGDHCHPLWRPFLELDRGVLEAFAVSRSLTWVEDESNRDIRLSRNYLRNEIFPLLESRWPSAVSHLLALSLEAAAAAEELEQLAREDLEQCLQPDGSLGIAELMTLRPLRRDRLVRHWLRLAGFPMPSRRQLLQVFSDVVGASSDAAPCVAWGGVEIHRFRGRLYGVAEESVASLAGWESTWDGVCALELPDGSRLELVPALAGERGVPESVLAQGLRVTYRGEALQGGQGKKLKKLLQELGIPPWLRGRQPLVYAGDRLLAVGEHVAGIPETASVPEKMMKIRWLSPEG